MNPITVQVILESVLKYGPSIIPLVERLYGDVKAGRANKELTAEDLAELSALASQTSADIYRRAGVTPPPAT